MVGANHLDLLVLKLIMLRSNREDRISKGEEAVSKNNGSPVFYGKTRTLNFLIPLNEDPRSANGTKSKILKKFEEE